MKVLIIDNHTDFLEPLKSLLDGFEIHVKFYTDLVIEDKDNYDLIILSGGYDHAPVYENPIVNKVETQIIHQAKVPLIGICYSCQMIAYTYLSSISFLGEKVYKIKDITFSKDFLDYKIGDKIKVKESHRYSVTTLGGDLEEIANSENGIEIIKVKDKEVYGFQFHPEQETKETGGDEIFIKLLNSFKK